MTDIHLYSMLNIVLCIGLLALEASKSMSLSLRWDRRQLSLIAQLTPGMQVQTGLTRYQMQEKGLGETNFHPLPHPLTKKWQGIPSMLDACLHFAPVPFASGRCRARYRNCQV